MMNRVHEANVLMKDKYEWVPPRNPYGPFMGGILTLANGELVEFAGDGLYKADWRADDCSGYIIWRKLPDDYYTGSDIEEQRAWARSFGVLGKPQYISHQDVDLSAEYAVDLRLIDYETACKLVKGAQS